MRLPIQFRLRTLMIAVALAAIALGAVVNRYQQQKKLIAEFMSKDVYIDPEYRGPKSLAWLLRDAGIFVRPHSAQVLIQPDGEHTARLIGETVRAENIQARLKGFQKDIKARLGIQAFGVVIGPYRLSDQVITALYAQEELRFVVTPCGLSNFPQFRELLPDPNSSSTTYRPLQESARKTQR